MPCACCDGPCYTFSLHVCCDRVRSTYLSCSVTRLGDWITTQAELDAAGYSPLSDLTAATDENPHGRCNYLFHSPVPPFGTFVDACGGANDGVIYYSGGSLADCAQRGWVPNELALFPGLECAQDYSDFDPTDAPPP